MALALSCALGPAGSASAEDAPAAAASTARPAKPERERSTGTWVGLRGGPPKVRTALAAALQTQASIRGMIDGAAVDLPSLKACRWGDVACLVDLGARHDCRVIVVGELARAGKGYTLRVARVHVEQARVVAIYEMPLDLAVTATDTANFALAGLTAAIEAAPTELLARGDGEGGGGERAAKRRVARSPSGVRGGR